MGGKKKKEKRQKTKDKPMNRELVIFSSRFNAKSLKYAANVSRDIYNNLYTIVIVTRMHSSNK